ncbi:Methyltransferase type 11 [Cordyceps militaris]|uniref:Methyltransferase type 11 n=1 Tax=Cordyceps militaris TaxID=73501 RepID=A0A2H4SB29_CORMI|nr:Methyltransferase type 11 [Cordyceps militaris]
MSLTRDLKDPSRSEQPLDGAGFEAEDRKYPFTISSWDDYHNYRPTLPPSMFAAWMKYHESHGGKPDVAHDIGAGSGTGAAFLSQVFAHTYVSDPGAANIAIARTRLQPASGFTFRQVPAEVQWPGPATVDMAVLCNVLHWTDAPVVMANLAATLRPGGSFACCMQAFRVYFPQSPRLDALWLDVTETIMSKLHREGALSDAIRAGIRNSYAGYEGVDVPEEYFENVRRWHVNVRVGDATPYRFTKVGEFEENPRRVRDGETEEVVHDPGWRRQVDADWLRGFLRTTTLPLGDDIWALPTWTELERVINDEFGGQVTAEWPVYMLLATRK